MKFVITFIFFITMPFYGFSITLNQKPQQKDSIKLKKADSLYNLGKSLFTKKRQFLNAKEQFDIADSLFQSLGEYKKIIKTKNNKYICLRALFKSFKEKEKPLLEALNYINKIEEKSIEEGLTYKHLGLLNLSYENHETSIFFNKKAIEIFNTKKNNDKLNYYKYQLNIGIGFSNKQLYNYKTSENYYNKALNIAKNNNIDLNLVYSNMFELYVSSKQNQKAALFLKNNEIQKHFKNAPLFISYDYYLDKIDYYSNINNENLEIKAIEELNNLISNSGYKNHFTDWFYKQNLALVYVDKKKYKKAIDLVSQIKYNKKEVQSKGKQQALDYAILGECYYNLNKKEKSLHNINLSLQFYLKNKSGNFFTKKTIDDFLIIDNSLINKLLYKAKVSKEIYFKTNDKKFFEVAISTFTIVHECLKYIGAKSTEDEFINQETFTSFYADLLDFYHLLWLKNPTSKNFYKAFQLCDESKIITILKEVKTIHKAKLFNNIPKNIIKKEKQIYNILDSIAIKYNITKNVLLLKKKDSIDFVLNNYKKKLKKNYPNYYQLKYGSKKSVKEIIKQNYKNYNVIEFFVSNDYIYVFNINNEIKHFDKIKLTPILQKNIRDYIKSIRNTNSNIYKKLGSSIYKNIFKKYIDFNKKTAIILDGDFHLFPIESLWIPSNNGHFLIEFTSVLRLNSISQEVVVPNFKKLKAVLFAPYASKNINNLQLSNSLNEVNQINAFFEGEILLNEKATKKEFLNNTQKYNIIHLATHALIDKKKPLNSKIFFNNSNNLISNNNGLKMEELYNMEINSNLVTLSACETGIGKDVKGKGVLSLSNAFAFAGVSSTVMSLWKIPDNETSQIMISFYKNLKEKKNKDIALQKAKIDYLQSTEDIALKHPYYWAGFVISGDASAIISTNNNILITILTISLIIIVLFFIFKKLKP